jgi:hypothetical protein
MAKDDKDLDVFQPDTDLANSNDYIDWMSDPDLQPAILADIKEALGLELPMRQAKDMSGETFIIVGARPFPGKFGEELDPLYCTCVDEPGTDPYGMVIGGTQPKSILYGFISAGMNVPLEVKLNFHEGEGKHGGYYTLD